MKKYILPFFCIVILTLSTITGDAQSYRGSTTEALQNSGGQWVQKKLPPSLLTFSDYSGQVNIKSALSSLFVQSDDSVPIIQSAADTMADFTMMIDKNQLNQQPVTAGKTFTTNGTLVINGVSKKTSAQYELVPRNNPADGYIISVVIRFNPIDFGMKINGETENDPLIVKVTNGYLNKTQSNF